MEDQRMEMNFMNKKSTYELAVYRVKEDPSNNSQMIVKKTSEGLAKFNGFIKRTTLQSVSDPLLFRVRTNPRPVLIRLRAIRNERIGRRGKIGMYGGDASVSF